MAVRLRSLKFPDSAKKIPQYRVGGIARMPDTRVSSAVG
jgi:hypothetical protein